jgi:hypothetical protein
LLVAVVKFGTRLLFGMVESLVNYAGCVRAWNDIETNVVKCRFCDKATWRSMQCAESDDETHLSSYLKHVNHIITQVILTDDNDNSLLYAALEELKEACNLLAEAAKLDPAVTDLLTCKAAVLPFMPFRLLYTGPAPRPDVFHSFIAVSYCWHSPEWRSSGSQVAEGE